VTRFYLDIAPVIYAVEHLHPYAAAVDARLSPQEVERLDRFVGIAIEVVQP
jgi:hypothetical protein